MLSFFENFAVQRGRSAVVWKILQCNVRTGPLQCSAGAVQ